MRRYYDNIFLRALSSVELEELAESSVKATKREAVAAIVTVLRVDVAGVETQAVANYGVREPSRPVVPVARLIVQITSVVVVAASAH